VGIGRHRALRRERISCAPHREARAADLQHVASLELSGLLRAVPPTADEHAVPRFVHDQTQ